MDQHRLKTLNNNRRRLPSHRPVDEKQASCQLWNKQAKSRLVYTIIKSWAPNDECLSINVGIMAR